MRLTAILLLGTVIGVGLAVLFSREYPLVSIDAGIITVCAVVGCFVATVLVLAVARLANRPAADP